MIIIDCLFKKKVYNATVRRIQSKDHQLSTVETVKQVFQPLDDKRFYLDNGINSIPFGHHRICTLGN